MEHIRFKSGKSEQKIHHIQMKYIYIPAKTFSGAANISWYFDFNKILKVFYKTIENLLEREVKLTCQSLATSLHFDIIRYALEYKDNKSYFPFLRFFPVNVA